jgi:hypothetical protein
VTHRFMSLSTERGDRRLSSLEGGVLDAGAGSEDDKGGTMGGRPSDAFGDGETVKSGIIDCKAKNRCK